MSIPSPSPLGPLQDDPASGLSFRLREPRPAAPKALLLLLHGVGGNEGNLAPLADAADPDMLVVLPRGPLAFAPGQYGWFRVAFTADGPSIDAAEAEQSRLALIRLIGQLQAAWRIEPRHTVIAGFSQGGILSASVGLTAPHSVAGFAVLSGRILPELEPQLADRTQLAGLRAFIAHGAHDSKLPVSWAQRADQWLDALQVPHETRIYPIDHGLSAEMQADFLAWLKAGDS
ncbi:phospholipase [Rhodanobacter sp. FW510-R12]|uniref:alpha/beta hydrolase n=1 Tax=unclassified Rhodanobacter TaxID=2621553 RepID=UPI0007A9D265|nr:MULTISPECIES: phospholipase [unclassified Rhodanobacter]KZC15732.1 phospholipase [Rhodanobacter sp. FW104-R8]KZC28998.1 phospholipase [Rhodanobacter sp. FW510-T8]KZC29294.1 phospholipase [Rhodanobacter sp. FW510-R10]